MDGSLLHPVLGLELPVGGDIPFDLAFQLADVDAAVTDRALVSYRHYGRRGKPL